MPMKRFWRRAPATTADVVGAWTGVLGTTWRARVTPWGDVHPSGHRSAVRWFVAADDRWHRPADEVSVRQSDVDGTPIFETRLRVPSGDVVQRVWSTLAGSDHPVTVVEFVNESPLPVAVAVTGDRVLTERRTAPSETPGLDIGEPARVLPIGHRATVRVVVSDAGDAAWTNTDHEAVRRGWTSLADRAGRFVVPGVVAGRPTAVTVVHERCQLALDPEGSSDPIDRLIEIDQRRRTNVEAPDDVEVAELAGRVLEFGRRLVAGRDADVDAVRIALTVAERSLASDRRAREDLLTAAARLRGREVSDLASVWPDAAAYDADHGPRAVAALEDRLARPGPGGRIVLLPAGFPVDWRGQSLDVHGLAVGAEHRVSFAVRWHGERPAVLWEVDGPSGAIVASGVDRDWSSAAASGEALWSV